MLVNGTSYVLDDEPAMALYEMNLQSPGSRGFHRYQIIHVIRDGNIFEYRQDLGLARKFKHDQVRIPSYMEHTVGELRDIADFMRDHPPFNKRELAQVDRIKE